MRALLPFAPIALAAAAALAACGGESRESVAADGASAALPSPPVAAAPPPPAPAPAPSEAEWRARRGADAARDAARAEAGEESLGFTATAATVGATGAAGAAKVAPGAPPQAPASAASAAAATTQEGAAPAMVIRTGTASVEVDSLEPAIAAARAAVDRLGGWVANASVQGGRDQVRSATLELKVPAARFDALTGALGTLGKLERLDVTAEDVGEEYVDVQARVANARRLETRLIDLLARSTGRLADVLAVERELARVREEIERYEGRLRYLRTRAATSTLTLAIHEPLPIVGTGPGRSPIAEAFRQAWRNFVAVVAGLIASLGVIIPLGALGAALYFAARPVVRRHAPPAAPPPPAPPAAPPTLDESRRDRAA